MTWIFLHGLGQAPSAWQRYCAAWNRNSPSTAPPWRSWQPVTPAIRPC